MTWQELVLTFGEIFFSLALIPTLLSKDKPQIWTSILTAFLAFSFSLTYLSLSLPIAAIAAIINALAWSILAIQRYRQS